MDTRVDFFIVGAQKAGTSWMYACLFEHPSICIPDKEPHFFSREKNLEKGLDWYENLYSQCPIDSQKGECSTSYLSTPGVAELLKENYPDAKIIISLRNPIDRAFSHYRNSIKAGEIPKDMSFEQAQTELPNMVDQGKYFEQVMRYMSVFGRDNVLVVVYEDIQKEPEQLMRNVFAFLEVDPTFQPSFLHRRVNTARTPKLVVIDRALVHIAKWLRTIGLQRLVWIVKKSGVPALFRKFNTSRDERSLSETQREALGLIYRDDIGKLSEYLKRDLVNEWNAS